MMNLDQFKQLLNQFIDSENDAFRVRLLAACKTSVAFTKHVLTNPQFLNKIDAQSLYDLYIHLKHTEATKGEFYQDETIVTAQQSCAAALLRVIYNKNDLTIIKKIFEEKSVTVEMTALSTLSVKLRTASVTMGLEAANSLLAGLVIRDDYKDDQSIAPIKRNAPPLSFKILTLLLTRCNKNLAFALIAIDRFPDLIPKLESQILLDLYLELSKVERGSPSKGSPSKDEKTSVGLMSRKGKAAAVHAELTERYGPLDNTCSQIRSLQSQAGKLTDQVDITLKGHIKSYQDRINFLGIRKSKISRVLFAELSEFVNEEGLAVAGHISPKQQLDKQCELYHILHGYMSNPAHFTKAFYNELKPLYTALGTNLGNAYQEFKTILETDDVKRENYYKARVKRIIDGYNHDDRSTKSTVSKQLVGTMDGLLSAEDDANKSNLLLPQYTQVGTAIGTSLQLSLAPLMNEIQAAPTIKAR